MGLQQHATHLTKKYEQLSTNYEQHMTHLTEKYEQLSANYEQPRQMVMNSTSQKDDTCAPFFWQYGPGNNQLPPLALSLF